MIKSTFSLSKVALFTILLIYVNGIGCPFWKSYASNRILHIQKIILLKSNPQNEQEDIAALIMNPFSVGIFDLNTNQQYELAEKQEAITFYQVDKDDRSSLKVSLLHTLDANGRVIDWNPLNGLKQNVIQIPKNININQESCLNSQEKLVFSWNTTHIFLIDYTQQLNQNQGVIVGEINFQRQLIKCLNDKPNRRFLIIDSQGGIRSFDIQSQMMTLLIQLDQFNQLQSIFLSQSQIAISYFQINNQNLVVSYKGSQLQFQQKIGLTPTQVLISNQEDQLIVIGLNNLFQVWQINQNKLIYQADFQSIKCDFRDSTNINVDSIINFKFGSVSKKDEVVAISDKYLFAFSLDQQQSIAFKNQNFQFNFIQAYIINNKIIIGSDQTVSILDKLTQKFNYVTNSFLNTESNYDIFVKIEVDVDLNRIIFTNLSGTIFIWSYFDNLYERFIPVFNGAVSFFIDRQLNKLVSYAQMTQANQKQKQIVIIDYRNGIIIDTLLFSFSSQIIQSFYYVQDKTNGYLLGYGEITTQYQIFRFQKDNDHTLIFNGTLLYNSDQNLLIQSLYIMEKQQQILLQFSNKIFLFNYFYKDSQFNSPILIQGLQDTIQYYYINTNTLSLYAIQQSQILIFSYTQQQFQMDKQFNILEIKNPINTEFIEEQQVIIVLTQQQIYFNYYYDNKIFIFNLQNQPVIKYVIDKSQSILITINNSYYLYVINIKDGNLLYSLILDLNQVEMFNIYIDQQIVTISSINGKTIIFNYTKYTLQGILNYQKNQAQFLDSQNNNLLVMSRVNLLNKVLPSFGLIKRFQMKIITNYYYEKQSGLLFILSNQVLIYNFKSQEYLPPFPTIDIEKAQYIYAISLKDFIFIQFSALAITKISIYKLSTYQYIGDLDISYKLCASLVLLNYDQYLNRLFAGCTPQYLNVWDLNQNFKLIQSIKLSTPVSISFSVETKTILVTQYSWFSCSLDYYTLQKKVTVNGIFGDLDYERGLQFTWDQNGDLRMYDSNSNSLAFQHAHQGWVNSVIIDSTNMILTSIGQEQLIANSKGIALSIVLRFDNSNVYVCDNNGYIYQLNYPNLILKNMIQVYNSVLDMLYLDFNQNILIFGSSSGSIFGYYNLIDSIAPYAYQNYQSQQGILSVSKTEKGILFHQAQTGVQLWNKSRQQIQYGFYTITNYQLLESKTQILLLQGQEKKGCLVLMGQIIFFDLETLDVLNVQRLNCVRNIQILNFLICSFINQLTILKVNDYSTFQTILQNENQSTISLQNIDTKNSFFITTTQGEVICYSFDQAANQFKQQFYSKLFDKPISNYLFIKQNNYYYFFISCFTGQFGYLQISQQLTIQTQKLINFQGTTSHAHKIVFQNEMVFVKRVSDLYLGVYGLEQFNQINKISSPCLGYTYKFDISTNLDIILQHCVGIYQVNSFSNFKQLASGRYTNQINLPNVYTPDQNQIIFINKNYFIDVYNHQIFIYQIDYAKAKVIMLGNFFYPEKYIGQIVDYFIFQDQKNTYIQILFYSISNIGILQLPISGENICQEKIAYEQFTQTLFQIQLIFQRIQSYYLIQKLIFSLTVVQETVLQPLPQSSFSQITQIDILFQIPGRQSSDVQKVYVSESLFQSFNGYFSISLENLILEPAIKSNIILIYPIQDITQFQLINIQFASQVLYSFQIQRVQSVLFDRISLLGVTIVSDQPIILFHFMQVKNIKFKQIFIIESSFTQVIVFQFESDTENNNPSQIQISNLQINKSSFVYDLDDQNSAPIYIQKFNEVKLSQFTANDNKGSAIPLLKSFMITKYSLEDLFFMNNINLMLLQYSNSIQSYQNDLKIIQQKTTDAIQIQNLQISNNRFSQPSLFPIFSITVSQLQITDISAELNIANSSYSNSLFNLQPKTLIMTNITLKENQGFQNLFMNQNILQGSIKNLTLLSNLVISALSIRQSQITISNSQIQQNQSKQTKQSNSVFNILQNSKIIMNSVKFEQNKSNNGGSLFVSLSQLFINKCSFLGDTSIASGGSIFSQNSQLTIYQSEFQQCSSLIGGCLYVQEGYLNITETISQNTIANQSGGFLYISQVDNFVLENVKIFNSVSSGDGGSLYISQSIGTNSIIKNNTFINNQAKGSGGAIFLDSSNFQIVQSKFVSNSAGIGGAIRYINLKPSFMMKQKQEDKDSCNTYQNNFCEKNIAIIYGNSIASYPTTASILSSKYFNVHSEFPNFSFGNFQSGLNNFDLTIVFFDEFSDPINQIDLQNQSIISQLSSDLVKEISQYSCRAYLEQQNTILQNQTIKLDGATLAEYGYNSNKQGGCFLHNLKITGVPSSKQSMKLQLNGMKSVNKKNQFADIDNIQIDIQFRSCKTGEYYNQICQNCLMKECVECQNGTYSLVYPIENKKNECKSCDMSKVYSCYGDQIVLRENYWRKNNDSDLIYKCDIINNSCNGDAQKGYCAEGYVGALCSFCDISGSVWGESYQFDNSVLYNGIQCSKCSFNSSYLLREIIIFIIILLYMVFLVIQSQDSNCKVCAMRILQSLDLLYLGVSSFLSDNEVISKIIINQFQILSTLKYSLGLNISQLFSNLLTIPQTASQPINQFTYSFDCFFTKLNIKMPIQYFRFIFLSIIFPLSMIIFFFILVQFILSAIQEFAPQNYFFYKTKYMRLNVMISMLIVFSYIASQNIYQTALQNIFCDEYSGTYYMKSQMDQICYTKEHYFYILFLIGPVLFIVAIVYPSIMFLILYRNRFKLFDQKLKSINLIRRYGYLFKGYKKNTWWWEIFKTWYKFLIILLATYYSSSTLIQIQSIIFLQLIYLYLLMKYQPYQHSKMNILEKRSVICTLMIFQISIVYYYNQDNILSKFSQIGIIFYLVILFGRLFFSVLEVQLRLNYYLLSKMNGVRSFLRRNLSPKSKKGIKFLLKKYLFQSNWSLYNIIYKKNYDPYRVFSNWRKVRIAFQQRKLEQISNQKISKFVKKQKMIIPLRNFDDPFKSLQYGQCRPRFAQEQPLSFQQQEIDSKNLLQIPQPKSIFYPKQGKNLHSNILNISQIEPSNLMSQISQNGNNLVKANKKKHFFKLK
ncbi:transmembrane protein, putative (macronuclear) [Tetrahymena thermophila SB210]|uniref:Transmembrane protein, putative n=1 Tax=Tetrahymena thermophila (strain SB210) TaxID=312017 RepID=I7LVJ6_TETTS|nr:transmembrane protein, putative [Tetrahymena thermophila SB210]EAR98357.2 transmembrane protein, putative [Tetrahymena thermophila SB210]|eukprot:XP_001018602.2 transmembrane protein, putative [Tetrahymena thermophila SB210]